MVESIMIGKEFSMTRTSAYKFTTDKHDNYMINLIRGDIKIYNLRARAIELETGFPQKRRFLKVHGRLGSDNPYAYMYRRGGKHYRCSAQTIRPEHATRFDIYVHERFAY
jgi:hypothetical protein